MAHSNLTHNFSDYHTTFLESVWDSIVVYAEPGMKNLMLG